MNKRHSILRFLLTYLCVLLPLLVTSILVTQNFLSRAREEQGDKLNEKLAEIENLISEKFWDYRTKSVVLFENREFSSKAVLTEPYAAKEAIRLLQSLRLFDSSENELLLYYGEGNFYSPDGLVSPQTLFAQTLACTSNSTIDALEVISTTEFSIRILEGGASGGYLMFHIPAGEDQHGYMRSMEVLISFSTLEDMMETCLENENILLRFSVGDAEQSYFYYSEQGLDFVTARQAETLLGNYRDEPLERRISAPELGIQLWYNVEEQLAEFYELRNINIILLVVGLLLSVAISFGLSTMRFSQLKKLINNIVHKKISDKEKKRWARNEFDYIQTILDESIKESISVRKNALSYRKTLFQQAAILIFHGLLRERKEIQSVLKVCGTELCEEYFFLYGLKMDNEEQLERLHELFQGDIHYVLNEDGRRFIFVLCELPYFDFNMRKRQELAEKLQAVLGSVGISCNQIAMSQVYHQISMANYAYLEVYNILENASSKRARVLCWEEWTRLSGKVSVRVDDENLKEFREAVFEKDLERALSVLSSALKQKQKKKEDVLFLRYMLLQALVLEVNISGEEENQNLLNELGEINPDDGTAFESEIRHILQEYCRKEVPSSEREFAKVLQFVEENYTSFDLSLERVAEYLGISRSQMSKLFKSQIGVCYIDYVNQLRMQKAKELLAETDMSVKEIFRKVGYIDATNARKKFKVYWGMNPTEYRAMMQNGKPEEIDEPEIDENVSETEGE